MDDYADDQIGSLECEEIEGTIPAVKDRLKDYLIDYAKHWKPKKSFPEKDDEDVRLKTLIEEDSFANEEFVEVDVEKKKRKWDCESILSNCSTLYNHPTLIGLPEKVIMVLHHF